MVYRHWDPRNSVHMGFSIGKDLALKILKEGGATMVQTAAHYEVFLHPVFGFLAFREGPTCVEPSWLTILDLATAEKPMNLCRASQGLLRGTTKQILGWKFLGRSDIFSAPLFSAAKFLPRPSQAVKYAAGRYKNVDDQRMHIGVFLFRKGLEKATCDC